MLQGDHDHLSSIWVTYSGPSFGDLHVWTVHNDFYSFGDISEYSMDY